MSRVAKTREDVLNDWGEPPTPSRIRKRQDSRSVAEVLGKLAPKPKPQMKGTSFYLDQETLDMVKRASEQYKVPQSKIIIECVHAFFDFNKSNG